VQVKAPTRRWHLALATIAVLVLAPSSARAAVTIGGPLDIEPNDTSSIEATYVQTSLPAGGIVSSPIDGVITRWRDRGYTAGAVPVEISFRVLRPVGVDTFTAISSTSALLPISPGTYVFPARVQIQKGDYIGLTQPLGSSIWWGCDGCPGVGSNILFGGPFADGQTRTQASGPNELLTINADVEPDADRDGYGDESQDQCPVDGTSQGLCKFSFGRLKRNPSKGTALLPVTVPGAGTLSLSGKGVVKQRPARASAAIAGRAVSAAGTVKLLVKAKGKRKSKLNRTGKTKLKLNVTFTPTGGPPSPAVKKVTLRKGG
jgi:hypothetical protein